MRKKFCCDKPIAMVRSRHAHARAMATKRIRPKLLPPTLEGVTYMNNIKIPSTSELPWVTMAVSRVTHLRLNKQQRINAHVATAKGIKKE